MRGVRALLFALPFLLAGCAGTPPSPVFEEKTSSVFDSAAGHALSMIGKPYRYGGASPAGFDCSGLVHYSFRQAGARIPRDTDALRLAAHPVEPAALRRGDLIFFDQEGKKNSHVGIYLGDGRFVHAPSSGKSVRSDRLDSPYWRRHLSETRRLSL
jgi:cell wall-associated NlpC family hydrolase